MLTQDPIGLAGGVNLYAYAGNNPLSYSDPYGLCPDKTPGKICVAFFIPSKTALGGYLKGDGRGFESGSHPRQSRAYAIIDPERPGMSMTVVNPTCRGNNSGCKGSTNSADKFTVTPTDNGGFHIHVDLKNSKTPGAVTPAINAEIDIKPDGSGGFTATGVRDGYPAAEGYYTKPDGSTQVLFQKGAGGAESLGGGMEEKIP